MDPVSELPEELPDDQRRRLLLAATAGMGAVGLVCTAIPLVDSWWPSERARALGGPVSIDTQKIEAGNMVLALWRKRPIVVVRRTPQMLAELKGHDDQLKDPRSLDSQQPGYAQNAQRSRVPDLLVLIGVCTHLGCLPKGRLQPGEADMGPAWPGGFYCPCHGSRFDLAGRVFKGSPASTNLVIPPYELATPAELVVGRDQESG